MENKVFNRNSISIRLFIIGFMILLLMIPSIMIGSLIYERQNRQREAIGEITSKWAQAQTIGGPVVTIPYKETWKDKEGRTYTEIQHIQFLPNKLDITGSIIPEIRYRGIFKAILYNAKTKVRGSFSFNKLDNLNLISQNIIWDEAFLSFLVPDMRGIKDYVELDWNGRKILFEPGIKKGNDFFDAGISVKVPVNSASIISDKYNFSFQLNLNGSQEFNFLPLGQTTTINLSSSWSNPSFDGAFLPEKRQVSKDGFIASWKVLDLNRNYSQQWLGETNKSNIIGSGFGVQLISPVDQYTKTSRSIKYLIMFVGLTFLVFFLVEIFNKKRIHPVQYLLIGLSLCIFYILLLSLSEHLNFELAYFIAGLSIITLISSYVRSIFGGFVLTAITAGLLVALYGYLYILLQNQDYALLMGSIGIFIIMAIVMYLSRKIEWYKIELNE